MTGDELIELVGSGEINTVMVAFTDHYGRLMGKRFDAEFFIEDGLANGTHACNYLLTTDMEMEPVSGYSYANWEGGYGDFHLVPDLSTLGRAGWTENAALVLCDVVNTNTHVPVAVAPRTILKQQVAKAASLGFEAQAASELEFFIYSDTYREAHELGYSNLKSAGWYIDDYHLLQGSRVESYVGAARRALRTSGIPVENSKGEAGRGQHELNIRYAEVQTMADRHVVMKHGMKELADKLEVSVTFMAKPSTAEAGNSCHIHLSLWDAAGDRNVFVDDAGRSDIFRWFLGGWMTHMQDLMICYAPTINSYKRFREASWAPTRLAWSEDNRTAGFRVVGHGSSTRIECRIPGGDCNPYLAYAAALASGLDGIEQRIEPPTEFKGDAYSAADLPRVPATLEEALANFRASDIAERVFGPEVVEHYSRFAEAEVDAFHSAVTDWEQRRYFEQI
ncbi:MAG: glutamine synthetase [Acidimicrobiales bacterium]|nr:glutamine synthetase [Acidimicrobiales bacterium]